MLTVLYWVRWMHVLSRQLWRISVMCVQHRTFQASSHYRYNRTELPFFWYLALGMYMQDVALEFRIGISTVSNIVHSTSKLLWRTLQPLYLEVCILHMQLVFMLQSHRTIIHTLCKLSTFSSHNQHLCVVFCSARWQICLYLSQTC